MIVGIDLGTTNSLLAIAARGGSRLVKGEDGSSLVPSVVYFPKSGEPIVGSRASIYRRTEPSRTLFSVKRLLGKGKGDFLGKKLPFDVSESDESSIRIRIDGKIVDPVQVSSLILAKLKALGEAQLGQAVERAVVTVPAYFNEAQRQATRQAAERAGLEVVRIINEPTAACLAYGLDRKAHGTVAVFDLGGGTFDISVLRIQNGIFEVLATSGDTELGGDDFDFTIATALQAEAKRSLGVDPLSHGEERGKFVFSCEALKKQLTENETTEFTFSIGAKRFQRQVRRDEIASWVRPVLERTRMPCLQCLKDAGFGPEKLDDVILVGGSTKSPFVGDFVRDLFRREPICSINPEEVVAMGAAVLARVLEGKLQGVLLLDVTPLSLGIETVGGIVEKIIHRNSTIPTSAAQTFTTSVDGQTGVDIHVLQGERELVADNRSLARFKLGGLPPMPAGIPKIEVEFVLDANGLLSARATELRSGRVAHVAIQPTYGLTDDLVEKQLLASYENAESDFQARFLAQARTEADSIIRATRKSLARGQSLLEPGEETSILATLGSLERSLESDHREISAKIEDLNAATQRFAERLLNHSVAEALKDKRLEQGARKDPS